MIPRPALIPLLLLPLGAWQNPTAPIAAEIDRIERESASGTPSEPSPALKAAREALRSGRTYLALERLAQAVDQLRGARSVAEKSDAVKSGMPAFEAELSKASASIASSSRDASAVNQARAPAALRALSETALARTSPLLAGGRGFATALAPKDGLYYLGEARGQAEFAAFCRSLALPRKGRPWAARSLLPELLALQAKTDAAFVPPRSIEQHPRFIALNSTLKLARELDSSRSYCGALYQYLEAVRHFAMLDAPPVDEAARPKLQAAVEAARAKTAASSSDDSIPLLLLERIAALLAPAEGTPGADDWRNAQVTLAKVLPAYSAALKPASSVLPAAGKTIDLTLVRWPYT